MSLQFGMMQIWHLYARTRCKHVLYAQEKLKTVSNMHICAALHPKASEGGGIKVFKVLQVIMKIVKHVDSEMYAGLNEVAGEACQGLLTGKVTS